MKNRLILLMIVLFPLAGTAQTATEILTRSITYHDPNGYWNSFEGDLHIDLAMPDGANRKSSVSVNLPEGKFSVEETRENNVVLRTLDREKCEIFLNGKPEFTEEEAKKFGLTCDRANMYKNYYTFLYGLPMKLKDEGTILHESIEKVNFKEKPYLKLKITFDEAVGSDTWYIYLNPESYAMEVYQFYHDESKNDGEYILLSEIIEYQRMRIPKVRKWYTNKEDKYLGTDDLIAISSQN